MGLLGFIKKNEKEIIVKNELDSNFSQVKQIFYCGAIITFISCSINKTWKCKPDCYQAENCRVKSVLMINPQNPYLCFTEVILEILNTSEKTWEARRGNWKFVDCDAYKYSASELCYDFVDSGRIKDQYGEKPPPL